MKYAFGHVTPWWDNEFKTLNYRHYPLNNKHDEERWIKEGYTGITLNGWLYNMDQPMPKFADPFFTLFDWDNIGLAFYRMDTLYALPVHQDSYVSYRKKFNIVDPSCIWRGIVFLEDWKSGHYFEIDNRAYLNWKAGDYVYWNNDVPHFAGNFGVESRYTMQITGMKSL